MRLTVSSSFLFLHGPPSPLIMAGFCPSANPFELYSRIASARSPSFLLESGSGDGTMGRYSYFGSDPYQTLTGTADQFVQRWTLGHTESGLGPYQRLMHLVSSQRIDRPLGSPPFFGGAVGYFSYDLTRQFERLPSLALHDTICPDLEFAFFDVVGTVDHELGDLVLMFCPPLERFLGEPRDKLFREGTDRLAAFEAQLTRSVAAEARSEELGRLTFTPEQSRPTYMQSVRRCQEYIASGDIYQANLSHRFAVSCDALTQESLQTDLAVYRRLRTLNPSPFSGLLRFDTIRLISSSPERLVRLDGRRADTRPIAGTRPRGKTVTADQQLVTELRANTKEQAEHIMLVDLERNDLGRVCRYGSVRVEELMTLEQYSHVNHLVSQISGTLRPHVTGFDLLKAMFPGGTITGVPKIRCMEIIEELEPVRRGPYTGSMGYLSWSGDMDFNILIRTLVMMNGVASLQVGAGVVADSDPAREYEETIHKAQAFFSAFS
ncbi:MAG: anthranilate synthase component I family protein [Nitrospira sp.]|nr:anthranilate synthase component I family protein [Nitrospira sp.]